jgi:Ca2+-transporting ATPase
MASGPRPELPTIITTDTSHPPPVFRFSSEDDPQQRELDYDDGLHSQENSPPGGHGRTPSLTAPNPAHLSPRNTIGLRPPSRDNNSTAPSSPGPFTPGTSERSPSPLTFSPPSPTGSARSGVHFSSTLQLRENDPDRKKGLDSLQFLHQHDHAGHGRRPSFSSMDGSTEGTEPDHLTAHSIILPLTPLGENNNDDSPMSRATSTTVQPSQSSPTSTAAKKLLPAAESNMPNEEEDDENVDPAPFAFRPTFLANLVQDKNFGALRDEAEGIEGVLSGLRTDPAKGLGITGTGGAKGKEELEARKRVYGVNELPARKSKSLFTLMWLALKDPVLVRCSFRIS